MPVDKDLADASGADAPSEPLYQLTLFVCGASPLSARAVTDARGFCDVQLAGRARLMVVDIHDDAHAGADQGVLVTPSLVRTLPLPVRKIVGDLSDPRKLLAALDLVGNGDAETAGATADKRAG